MLKKIKYAFIKHSLDKRKRSSGFNLEAGETFKLPLDAEVDQNNSYYFSAHDLDGNSLFLRLGLRGGNSAEVWFTYKDNQHFFVAESNLFKTETSPLTVTCIEVGKRWSLSYQGMVVDVATNKKHDLNFVADFMATHPALDFFHDLPSEPLAEAIANEKWTKAFFKEVAKNNQVHYEQQGKISGTIELDGNITTINLNAIRDHSYGTRMWDYMNNHMWLLAIDEGGSSVNVSMVSYPSIKKLLLGNIYINDLVVPFSKITYLSDLTPHGDIPSDIRLELSANKQTFNMTATKECEVVYQFEDGKYTLIEGIGSFNINGKKARGIIEFGFNINRARWH